MISPVSDSPTLALLEKTAAFAERRQDVLAGNIANIDTPGYKTRDLPVEDFQKALQDAVKQLSQPQSLGHLGSPASRSLSSHFPAQLFRAAEAQANNITFQDGANRSIEHEVMEMTKNSMLQSFLVELMMSQMNLLQSVISERP